jgi:hypothetical protein
MELSENLKLRLDQPSGENPQDRLGRSVGTASPGDAGPGDEAESQMRRALGLLGESSRNRPDQERMEQPSRGLGDRFNGGLHRRRFVQDGDVPVTVLRRDPGYEQPTHRGTPATAAPTSSRLQRTEAALTTETAARERAERSLAETQTIARDLQTKIGHAELAKTEAVEALRQERESMIQLRGFTTPTSKPRRPSRLHGPAKSSSLTSVRLVGPPRRHCMLRNPRAMRPSSLSARYRRNPLSRSAPNYPAVAVLPKSNLRSLKPTLDVAARPSRLRRSLRRNLSR